MKTILAVVVMAGSLACAGAERPNIILVMADDQGWGQTGYYDHPVLKTPHLDAMAANGLRFDRFYAGASNCSPTRATVLTGRSNDRTGVHNHGYALRKQEKTVAQALQQAGYATGHFGKWHLNGVRGPGIPIPATDDHNPGEFGFDEWLSVSNFFDRDPIMSRQGKFEEFEGDSSEIIVREALKFVEAKVKEKEPFFAVIWYGTPHSPWMASEEDREEFKGLDRASEHHYGELVAMDRSIGTLRDRLRDLGIASDTLVWFCSDNGGLPRIEPDTVGGLRGFKNSLFEGGLRVPAVIEWPAVIEGGRVTRFPAATLDIFPTLAEVAGLPESDQLQPADGISLQPVFEGEEGPRAKPIPFRHAGRGALVDNDYKLLKRDVKREEYELYNLAEDPSEMRNLISSEKDRADRLINRFQAWNESVEASVAGKDYPEGRVNEGEPEPRQWTEMEVYQPYFEAWKKRPEYRQRLQGN